MGKTLAVYKPSAPASKIAPKSVLAKVEFGIGLGLAAHQLFLKGKEIYRKKFGFSVVISENDLLYAEVHDWLVQVLPTEKHKDLTVSSTRSTSNNDMEESDSKTIVEKPKPLIIRFNENTQRKITVGDHPITVHLQKPDPAEIKNFREPEYSKIIFQARSYEGQQAVIKQLEILNSKRATTRKAVLKMVNQWSSWSTRSDLPPRTMESVALPAEQKKRIVEDLEGFLKSEEQYNKLAIPWHRGYMFYGPPGTGKTSLVKALANEFNLDLWYVSLSDLSAESSLLALLGSVGPRSLLLLEDIDTIRITHDRDGADQGKISMSSLLNTLDGVATPHGLITIMTTNRFEILDDAIKRAGRMDLVEELGYPSANTLGEMFKHFYGRNPDWLGYSDGDRPIEGLSTAQIAEIMKRNMDDPDAAEIAIIQEFDRVFTEKVTTV